LNIQFSIKFVEFNLLLKQLNKLQYSIFQQSTTFYAYKGLIGRVAPIIVHLSIILILYGSVIGSFSGFTAQEFVPKTEIFHIQNIIKTGMISYIPQKTFRINDFWVQYNKEKTIKQFYSSISLLTGNGQELLYKTISVNKPLFYNDLIFYQTDWGITGLRIQSEEKNKEILQLPLYEIPKLNKKLWVSWLSVGNSVKKGILFLITQNQIQIYTQEGNFLSSLNINEFIELENLDLIKLIDVISSTGIQIKWDEGIIIIYIGFFLLILSSLLSYISFSELWGLKVSKKVFSGGKTNRAQLKFFLEIKKIK
jgi:cytochrome c biogenesis protein